MSLVFDVMAMLCYSVVILYGVYRYSEGGVAFYLVLLGMLWLTVWSIRHWDFYKNISLFIKKRLGRSEKVFSVCCALFFTGAMSYLYFVGGVEVGWWMIVALVGFWCSMLSCFFR